MATTAARQLRASATKSYDKSKHRLLVIGGNGFVGSNILQRAVQKGIEVRSLNKSGKPQWQDVPWIDQVDWRQGDVFNPEDVAKAVEGVTGVSKWTCVTLYDGVTVYCVDLKRMFVLLMVQFRRLARSAATSSWGRCVAMRISSLHRPRSKQVACCVHLFGFMAVVYSRHSAQLANTVRRR